MRTDVAFRTDLRSRQNNGELPYPGAIADILTCNLGQIMHECFAQICFH
jgi:hypothetical protein